MSSVGTGQI